MDHFKLQLGCLVILLFIIAVYIRETMHRKLPRSRLFDALLIVCPCAVVLDGLTAWTVNHMSVIPAPVNLVLHAMFYLAIDAVIVVAYLYMLQTTDSLPHRKSMLGAILLPALITVVIILGYIRRTYYVQGLNTNYSMGISAVTCYISLVVHFAVILIVSIIKRRTLQAHKRFGIFSFLGLSMGFLLLQVFYPESLISAMFPTILVLGFYITLEDPAIRSLEGYNRSMTMAFSTLIENRDDSTGGHIRRTSGYVEILLREMRLLPEYRMLITRDYYNYVRDAAPLHDIGKIATPDSILQKPGKLTDEEFTVMKLHAAKGGDIIRETFADLDRPEYTRIAYEVARYHHEKWNGNGYPEGLAGESIPLHARVMAIADVFDAVSAKRCYRDALPIDTCFRIIEEGAGRDFDPRLAGIFLASREKVLELYHRY